MSRTGNHLRILLILVQIWLPLSLNSAAAGPAPFAPQRLQAALRELAEAYALGDARAIENVASAHAIQESDGAILIVIEHNGDSNDLVSTLRKLGAQIGTVASGRLSALVPIEHLEHVATLPSVTYVRRPLPVAALGTTSQGLAPLGALAWHDAGYRGQGTTAAVIDMGFADLDALQASGDLPSYERLSVRNLKAEPLDANGQHGSAVAETLFDVAPDIDRLLLYALDDDPDLEAIVTDMISEGVDVAAMSLGWANASPYDGTGFLCDQVNRARDEGDILWVIAAGNQAHQHYEGSFLPHQGTGYHSFAPGGYVNQLGIFLAGSEMAIALSWDEWPRATSNYDLVLAWWNMGDWVVEHVFQDNGPMPTEGDRWAVRNTGLYGVMIQKVSGSDRHLELYYLGGDILGLGLEYNVSESSLMTPADADGAMAVGAFNYGSPAEIEYFSSLGPRNALGGGLWEGSCPHPNCKPDAAGPDGNRTASYGSLPFYGTSAAAPHVAGAAALVRGAFPEFSADDAQIFLEGRAVDQGEAGDDNTWGMGRVLLGAAPGVPTATPTIVQTPSAIPTAAATASATLEPSPTAGAPSPTTTPTRSWVAWLPLLLKDSAATMPTPTPPSPAQVSLHIAPHLYIAEAGEIVTLQIQVEAGAQRVDAAEVIIDFDATRLTIVDELGLPAAAIAPGRGLQTVSWNRVDNDRGRIIFMARQEEAPFPSGTFALATMRARVEMEAGSADLSFNEASDILFAGSSVLGKMYDARIIASSTP